MPFDPSTFDDLGFKQMVRRAWGSECCPLALRERVTAVAAEPEAPAGADEPVLILRPRVALWRTWGLAAAAAVVLAVGVPAALHGFRWGGGEGTSSAVASAGPVFGSPLGSAGAIVPVSLQQDLIDTHERCSHKADHHRLAVASDDDVQIAAAMRNQLSRAVLVARPIDTSWRFKGAAICRVGTIPCGHLVFCRGDEAISVFSLPASADPNLHDGDEISTMAAGHPITGFAKDGAIFCLVGSGPEMKACPAELREMRDRMESAVTAAPAATARGLERGVETRPEPDAALAELLQPINP